MCINSHIIFGFRWTKNAHVIVLVSLQTGDLKLSPFLLSRKWRSTDSKDTIMRLILWNWYSNARRCLKKWMWSCHTMHQQVMMDVQRYTQSSRHIPLWNAMFITTLVSICLQTSWACSHMKITIKIVSSCQRCCWKSGVGMPIREFSCACIPLVSYN